MSNPAPLPDLESRTTAALGGEPLPPLIPLSDAAQLLSCSIDTVRRMIARGDLKACRVGERLLRVESASLIASVRPIIAAK